MWNVLSFCSAAVIGSVPTFTYALVTEKSSATVSLEPMLGVTLADDLDDLLAIEVIGRCFSGSFCAT